MITIIIPVYNAEKHLRGCLDAVKSQTLGDFEVLLINDGSTDNSPAICSEYACSDSRFILHTILKGGVTPARKFGLSAANTDLICFIDSDDIIDCDYIERLYTAMAESGSDIVISGHFIEYGGKSVPVQPYDFTGTLSGDALEAFRMRGFISDASLSGEFNYKTVDEIFETYSDEELRKTLLSNRVDMSPTLWGKLIKKDLLLSSAEFAADHMARGEDCVMVYGAMALADSITVLDYKGYHYIQHPFQSIKSYKFDNSAAITTDNCLKRMIQAFGAGRYVEQVNLILQKSMVLINGHKRTIETDLGYSYVFSKNEIMPKDLAFRAFLRKRYNIDSSLAIGVCGAMLDEHALSIKALCLLAEAVRKAGKDAVFVIIGNGPLFAPLHGAVTFEGLEERFRFICTNSDHGKMLPMLDYTADTSLDITRLQCLDALESILREENPCELTSVFEEKKRFCKTDPPVLSIHVLCYQVGKFLCQCLESIVRQTFEDFEVIIIDDGSTDATPAIADYFAEHDSRFHVIHTENRGVTAGRKTALEHSRGEFIGCVDGDDWVEPEAFETALKYARENDCPVVEFISIVNKPSEIIRSDVPIEPGVYRADEVFAPGFQFYKYVMNSLCLKIVRRDIMNRVLPRIDDFVRLGEDCGASMLAVIEGGRFYYANDSLYHYRMRPSSITHSHDPDGYMRLLKLYECVCGYMRVTGRDKYIPYFGERVFALITKLMSQEALYTDGSDSEQTERNRQRDIAVMQADPRYYDIIDNLKEIINLGCIEPGRTAGFTDLLCRGEIPERGYFSSTLIDL